MARAAIAAASPVGGAFPAASAALALAAFAACAALSGCGDAPPIPPPPPGPPRFAHRFLPASDAWIPESQVPRTPQDEPHMVIWELSEHAPDVAPTPAQEAAARDLVARCRAAAEAHGWFAFEKGLADGYHLLAGDRRHYVNEEYLFDGRVLDCERPEFLMYYGTPQGKLLAGVMFYASALDARGPQIGGNRTLWHYHVWKIPMCLRDGLLIVDQARGGACREGEPAHRSPEMLHVWFLDHPDGPFATTMWLSREDLEAADLPHAAGH
ncbi:MAG: hypothetical protein R3E88_05410 [Myxococcota bacterium]